MSDIPSILMTDLARCHQEDLVREVTGAKQPRRRVSPVAQVRWWTGRVIIRTGEAIAGMSIAAYPDRGVANEHNAIY